MTPIGQRASTVDSTAGQPHDQLPAWPFMVVVLGYPVWWVLGLGDMAWPLFGIIMVLLLKAAVAKVPRGFGIWLLFMVWMACSFIAIDTGGRAAGFVFRYVLYTSVTIIFVYVYNARSKLTTQHVLAALCGFWIVVWVGGYLGLMFPTFELRTPLAFVLPDGLLNNELVREMAIRRLTQFNPDAFNVIDPRPSAPFLYTNGWGNAYSVLLPFVVAYLSVLKRGPWFWTVAAMIPVSLVPAVLSLNRGMYIGLLVGLLYVMVRLGMRKNYKALLALVVAGLMTLVVVQTLSVGERLSDRLEVSSTTDDRFGLYVETIERTAASPLFGYGAPRPSQTAGAPSVGTQGQVWMVLFSHGYVGLALFLGWLGLLFARTWRSPTAVGLICNTVVLVTLVEIFYYGILAPGLVLVMVAGALGMRLIEQDETSAPVRRVRPYR